MYFSNERCLSQFRGNKFELEFYVFTEAYPEPCQISKVKYSAKILKEFQPLTIFAKKSILDCFSAHHIASIIFLRPSPSAYSRKAYAKRP